MDIRESSNEDGSVMTTNGNQWRGWLVRAGGWLKNLDLILLLTLLFAVGGIWVFIELADEVSEGETQRIDEAILLALRNPDDRADPLGPEWLEEVGRDMTALGGWAVLTLVTLAVSGYLVMRRKFHALGLVLSATVGGTVLAHLLKELFSRPRPDLVTHLSYVMTASFPSGHSMMSAAVYLTLGALLSRLIEEIRLKVYFLSLALLLTFLVGFSRVYLGVHYPTDVLAGWAAGLSWALLCWLVAGWLQRRGMVEKPQETS